MNIITVSVKTLLIALVFVSSVYAGGDFNRQPGLKLKSSNKKGIGSYLNDAKEELQRKNKLFGLDVDIQLGLNVANTNFELNKVNDSTQQYNATQTKIGPAIGAILSLNFFGFGFTTGMQYSNKGFETVSGEKTSLNYFNIPLLVYFDFDIGQKIRVDGNLGPYFGLLLSEPENPTYGVKNFDLGLTGNLQFAYMFNKYMGVLLGGKYEYGGLNNLGRNENIKRITTSTFNIYSGLKFEL